MLGALVSNLGGGGGQGDVSLTSPIGEKPLFLWLPFREEWFQKNWGTGKNFDIIRFVELYQSVNFLEAVERRGVCPQAALGPGLQALGSFRRMVLWIGSESAVEMGL
jgi:hypothetical protein